LPCRSVSGDSAWAVNPAGDVVFVWIDGKVMAKTRRGAAGDWGSTRRDKPRRSPLFATWRLLDAAGDALVVWGSLTTPKGVFLVTLDAAAPQLASLRAPKTRPRPQESAVLSFVPRHIGHHDSLAFGGKRDRARSQNRAHLSRPGIYPVTVTATDIAGHASQIGRRVRDRTLIRRLLFGAVLAAVTMWLTAAGVRRAPERLRRVLCGSCTRATGPGRVRFTAVDPSGRASGAQTDVWAAIKLQRRATTVPVERSGWVRLRLLRSAAVAGRAGRSLSRGARRVRFGERVVGRPGRTAVHHTLLARAAAGEAWSPDSRMVYYGLRERLVGGARRRKRAAPSGHGRGWGGVVSRLATARLHQ
jgi:hypothetical protein